MKKIRVIQLLFLSLFLIGTYLPTQAQKIDTISVYSTSMKKQIKNIIILPASYTQNTQKKYPVAYLLHGYGGCYDTWATYTKPDLAQMASNFDMIIVCPDGLNSWYWDSPINHRFQYGRARCFMAGFPSPGHLRSLWLDKRRCRYPAFPRKLGNEAIAGPLFRESPALERIYRNQPIALQQQVGTFSHHYRLRILRLLLYRKSEIT